MADELAILGLIVFGLLVIVPLYFAVVLGDDDDSTPNGGVT